MKRNNYNALLFFSITFFALTSCFERPGDAWVNVDGLYKMEVPKTLYSTDGLNDEASLQYQNAIQNYYVVILDEPHEELVDALPDLADTLNSVYGFEQYVDLVANAFFDELDLRGEVASNRQSINGMPSIVKTLSATFEDSGIYYRCTYVKGENHYYQIICWCLSEDENKYDEVFEKMVNSFQEIKTKSAE